MENKSFALKNIFNLSTGMLVLLHIVTLGIYPLVWLWQRREAANKEVGAVLINETWLIVMAIMTGLNLICLVTDFAGVFGLAVSIGWVIFAFKARRVLVQYASTQVGVDLRMNGVWTLLFTVFYVTYCINDLPVLANRQSTLRTV